MNPIEEFLESAGEIEERIGYSFRDRNLLVVAFTHRSFINENRELTEKHNERLEFLGDAVLGLLVSEWLYRKHEEMPEGELSARRATLVQASACRHYTQKLDVDQHVLLGKGERLSAGRGRESIQANLLEALIGAIFVEGGLEAAKRFLFEKCAGEFEFLLDEGAQNVKAELQDYAQKITQEPPSYCVVSETGPDHARHFVVEVAVQGRVIGTGEGASKKEAQQNAAANALEGLS